MAHIVDTLIEERATNWRRHPWLWRHMQRWLKPVLLYDLAREMADAIAPLNGTETFAYMQRTLNMQVDVTGLGNIPERGAAVVTPNHPAGIADGVAVFDALTRVREDVTFFANRDAIRVCPGLADHIVPVEWRDEARTRSKTRETLAGIRHAFQSGRLIVVFPSGRLARPTPVGLWERPWQASAFALAGKYQAPVVPMHIQGHNSAFYYLLWFCNRELKDMTLFREIINKRGGRYRIAIGERFAPLGDASLLAAALRKFVTRDMRRGETRFSPPAQAKQRAGAAIAANVRRRDCRPRRGEFRG